MIAFALLLQAATYVGPPDPALPPSDPAAAFALFRSVCRDPFPDQAAFAAKVAAVPGLTHWQPELQIERLIPGETWLSPTLTLRYFGTNRTAAGLPGPQCFLTAAATEGTPPESLFALFAAANGLGAGKIVGKASYRTAMWDIDRGGGVRWRVIFGSERVAGRLKLKLSMLNLGTKR